MKTAEQGRKIFEIRDSINNTLRVGLGRNQLATDTFTEERSIALIADLFPDKSSLPATLNPPLVCSGVEWDLEVAAAVGFRRQQPASRGPRRRST